MQAVLFTATTSPDASRAFYEQTLGLTFVEDSPFALVFDVDGIQLRIQKVEQLTPAPFTALGFQVGDIRGRVRELAGKGVSFEQFKFLGQDDDGIWTTPDGAQIAWFRDPDGNLVSLSQGA